MDFFNTRLGSKMRSLVAGIIATVETYRTTKNDALIKLDDNIFTLTAVDETPQWNVPIVSDGVAYVDLRPFYYSDSNKVKNTMEASFMVDHAKLDLEWAEGTGNFSPVEDGLSLVFATWVSQIITTRFNLTQRDGIILYTTLYAYYISLFIESKELDSRDIMKITRSLTRNSDYGSEIINTILSTENETGSTLIAVLESSFRDPEDRPADRLDAVLRWANEVFTTPLEIINTGMLYNMLSTGSWIGYQQVMRVSAAIEHPPIFAVMVHRTMVSSFMSKTGIGKTVHMRSRKPAVKNMERWFTQMFR